jgi:hypothetical protein
MNRKTILGISTALILVVAAFIFTSSFSGLGLGDSCEWEEINIQGQTFSSLNELDQFVQEEHGTSLDSIDHASFEVRDGVVHGKLENCQVQTGEAS